MHYFLSIHPVLIYNQSMGVTSGNVAKSTCDGDNGRRSSLCPWFIKYYYFLPSCLDMYELFHKMKVG